MGSELVIGEKCFSKVVIGMTIKEANEFVFNNEVYYEQLENNSYTNEDRITEVYDQHIRCDPGGRILRVTTNSYGNITSVDGFLIK